MKRINSVVNDVAKDVLIDWKNRHGFANLDDALEDLLLKFASFKTYKQGWIRIHKGGCGGVIRRTENMDPSTSQVFDMECLKCGEMVCEEDTEFERK